jgi:superfamily II DNA or RNA helicase
VIQPRGYQQDVIDGAVALWRRGLRRIAAVLATGAGKTVIFSLIAALCRATGRPVLVIAHRTELIDQAIEKLTDVNPDARIGRMQGTVKQYLAEIVVGSIQTCTTPKGLELLKKRQWGLIVIDETHHSAAPSYRLLLNELRAYELDGPLVLGVTATLGRTDGLALGDIFEEVVEPKVGLIDLIRAPAPGPYLVPPRGIRVRIEGLDLDKVRRQAGDFNQAHLGAAMTAAMAPQRIVEAWEEHAKGRPTVAFLPTIAVSVEVAEAFRAAGYSAVHLDAKTPPDDRKQALGRFRAGEIDVLCNVALFDEGTDLPTISCVILGAPTSSTGRYQQRVGRGLRLYPGKLDCIILDVCGVTSRHKLATMASLAGADSPADMPDDLLMYEEDLVEAPATEQELVDGPDEQEKPEYADGDLAHELIDLFGQSHSSWLRTPGGHWFIPAGGQGFVYLDRKPDDRYDLCWATDVPGGAQHVASGVIQADMEIGYAMAAGDEYVAANPIWQAERDAPWRGLRTRGGKTRGEVADAKALERAAFVLDRPSR